MSSTKGPFQELIKQNPPLNPGQLRARRVELIKKIQAERKRPLVIYATNASINQPRVPAIIHRPRHHSVL
ncbi:MAG: hypothetical protein IPK13_11780 [Deltaproteobacteria bacterium]|nr:hypothetical protein [Deltaproteobacteria bacterium]